MSILDKRVQGDLQVLDRVESRRVNEAFETTLVLSKNSAAYLKAAGVVTLPSSATLVDYDGNVKSWRVLVKFASAGININYFDNSLAFTSTFAGQVVWAQLTDQAPLNNGTWDFYQVPTQAQLNSLLSWKNDVLSCGPVQPGAPVVGQRFLNTTTNQIEIWNGSAWIIEVTDGGDAVVCQSMPGGFYVKTGGVWSFLSAEASTAGLGITITGTTVATDNGDGLTYVGNKNTVLANPAGPITVGPLGVNVGVDNNTVRVVGGLLTKKSYTQNFNATTDWTPSGADYIIVIAGAVHLKGINPQWQLYGSLGEATSCNTTRNIATGDITLTVPGIPVNGRFVGSIDID
jgi:hypothetical protein